MEKISRREIRQQNFLAREDENFADEFPHLETLSDKKLEKYHGPFYHLVRKTQKSG